MANEQSISEPKINEQLRSSIYADPDEYKSQQSSSAQIFNMDVNYANENKWWI